MMYVSEASKFESGYRKTYISHFINLLEAGLQEGLETSSVGENRSQKNKQEMTRIYLPQSAIIGTCLLLQPYVQTDDLNSRAHVSKCVTLC